MRQYLTCAAVVVVCAAVVALCGGRVWADDPTSDGPPGGNSGLSWSLDSTQTTYLNQACYTANPCVGTDCYQQNVTYGGIVYPAWMKASDTPYGNCNSGFTSMGDTCTMQNSIECAQVTFYQRYTSDSMSPCGDSSGITVPLYALNGCLPQV